MLYRTTSLTTNTLRCVHWVFASHQTPVFDPTPTQHFYPKPSHSSSGPLVFPEVCPPLNRQPRHSGSPSASWKSPLRTSRALFPPIDDHKLHPPHIAPRPRTATLLRRPLGPLAHSARALSMRRCSSSTSLFVLLRFNCTTFSPTNALTATRWLLVPRGRQPRSQQRSPSARQKQSSPIWTSCLG